MPQTDRPRSRRELLINGRRVRISDLIDADLLRVGQELYFQQRIGLRPHCAVVTDRGRLRLADGREFDTPSGAAAAVAEVRAVPGWAVWTVGPDGPTLHQLRQELLETVAAEVPRTGAAADAGKVQAVRRRFDVLNEARRRAEMGDPTTLTVQEFLRLWEADERHRSVTLQIEADLANHGLATVPDFRAVSLDRVVQIIAPPAGIGRESPTEPGGKLADSAQAIGEEDAGEIALTLGNLLPGECNLAYVAPTATYDTAITAMQLNDYSQLAVLTDSGELHGVVSWKSIAEARHRNAAALFSDAIDRDVRPFDYNVRLLDVLGILQKDGFIFVRDHEERISGIVTTADLVTKYDQTATPFFLIGEVDQELRQLIQNTFDEATVSRACTSFRTFEGMTIGQYKAILDDAACWQQLGWPLDRELFITRLDEIRRIRNTVMHFNPDPIRPSDVEKLHHFVKLIRKYNR